MNKGNGNGGLGPWLLAIVVVLAITVAVVLLFPKGTSSDFEVIYLGPQQTQPILVLRNVENAFPVYAADFSAQITLALKDKEEVLNANAGSTIEPKIRQLYEQLDVINADARTAVIAAYTVYVTSLSQAQTSAERERASERFTAMMTQILEMVKSIRAVRQQINSAKVTTSSDAWDSARAQLTGIRDHIEALGAIDFAPSPDSTTRLDSADSTKAGEAAKHEDGSVDADVDE